MTIDYIIMHGTLHSSHTLVASISMTEIDDGEKQALLLRFDLLATANRLVVVCLIGRDVALISMTFVYQKLQIVLLPGLPQDLPMNLQEGGIAILKYLEWRHV